MGGIRRHSHHRNVSAMYTIRHGGRVTLANYNPKIAGGAIQVQRFSNAHRRGLYLDHNKHDHNIHTVSSGGAGIGPKEPSVINKPDAYIGMGEPPRKQSKKNNDAYNRKMMETVSKHLTGRKRPRRFGSGGDEE